VQFRIIQKYKSIKKHKRSKRVTRNKKVPVINSRNVLKLLSLILKTNKQGDYKRHEN